MTGNGLGAGRWNLPLTIGWTEASWSNAEQSDRRLHGRHSLVNRPIIADFALRQALGRSRGVERGLIRAARRACLAPDFAYC
jgi:hypothetical protein